jgi:hypothetical protein
MEALANSIEHDDRVVQRIADHGENRRDDREIKRRLRDRKNAEHEDRIMHDGENRAEREAPGVKPKCDVNEDQQEREAERHDRAFLKLVTHLRADDVEPQNLRARVDGFEGLIEFGADRSPVLSRSGRQPDRDIAR